MSKNIFHSSILLILAVFAPGVVSAAGLPYPIHQPLTRRGPILSNAAVLDPRQADDLELQAALDDVLASVVSRLNSWVELFEVNARIR